MVLSLRPWRLFADYTAVTAEYLEKKGIRLLLCDLDFTLAPKGVKEPNDSVRNWIASLHEKDITVMILSNNRRPVRVEQFCAPLGIPYEGHAGKPQPKGIYRAMARVGVKREETAMLGDKLLTDMLAANLAGVLGLMVEPLGGAVTPWQKVLHALQAPFKRFPRGKE